MISGFKYKGEWKLPDDKDWVNGELTFDPANGSQLEVYGSFNNKSFIDHSSKEIILGRTTEGDITLLDNWYRKKKVSDKTIVLGTYQPVIILQGHHFKNLTDIKFDTVSFEVFNLFQWLDKSGQKLHYEFGQSDFKIEYKEVDSIKFQISEKIKGEICFDGSFAQIGEYKRVEIFEGATVNFRYNTSAKYENILRDIACFVSFISLSTFEQSYPKSIQFQDEKFKLTEQQFNPLKKIFCYYQHSDYSTKHKIRREFQHLFTYSSIRENFPVIINKWFSQYFNFEPEFLLTLNYFKSKYKFNIDKFMDCARAIESYHRLNFNNKRIPDAEYKALVKKILKSVELSKADYEWLNGKLMGNEPSLKSRLLEIIDINQNEFIEEQITDINKFCKQVKDSRNYYTHYSKNLEKKAIKGKELADLTRTLRGLLIICILNSLGIDTKDYLQGLKYNLG